MASARHDSAIVHLSGGRGLPYSIASRTSKGQSFQSLLRTPCGGRCCWWLWGSFFGQSTARAPISPLKTRSPRLVWAIPSLFLSRFVARAGNGPPSRVILIRILARLGDLSRAGPSFNYAAVGVPADWHYNFTGFASHWNKNSNLGQAFDLWFLNLFPRERPFAYNCGGYLTLELYTHARNHVLGLFAGSAGFAPNNQRFR